MSRFKCNKQGECLRCVGCCHFTEQPVLDTDEDYRLRKQMWDRKGILYAYPFHKYTISISNVEKKRLESLAIKMEISVKFLPKKIMLDIDLKPAVLDWCLNAVVCPFLEENECLIYADRPQVCKIFPKDFMPKVDVEVVEHDISFEEALEIAKQVL